MGLGREPVAIFRATGDAGESVFLIDAPHRFDPEGLYNATARTGPTTTTASASSPWLIEGTAGDLVWQREATESGGSLWRGRDLGNISDTSLISPPLEVTEGEPLVIAFEHAFKFEYGDNIAWDGGVLEISDDQGESWTDVAAFVDPGYNGTINAAPNPIDKRLAFVNESLREPRMRRCRLLKRERQGEAGRNPTGGSLPLTTGVLSLIPTRRLGRGFGSGLMRSAVILAPG